MLALRWQLLIASSLAILACQPARDPTPRQPVIDMHLHAFGSDWVRFFKDTSWFPPGRVTDSDSLREQMLRQLEQHNIVKAVASGTDQSIIDRWRAAAPERIILSPRRSGTSSVPMPPGFFASSLPYAAEAPRDVGQVTY